MQEISSTCNIDGINGSDLDLYNLGQIFREVRAKKGLGVCINKGALIAHAPTLDIIYLSI